MATTTTNFGWDIPQSTDLVKDGATAIAALGQDIDTALVDLKGGTTGQILSKNSNSDLDFTWVAANPGDITGVTAGTGISGGGTSGTVTITNDMATTITASGDIVVGTGSGTYDNLPIGTTGQVLTADTTVSPYKVKWATPATGQITWTNRYSNPADGNALNTFAYNGSNLYVGAGENGFLYTSTDGQTWTSRTSGFGGNAISKVVYGNGIFVAVGQNGTITTSTDGTTWTARTSNMSTNWIRYVYYANGYFVAVGNGGGSTNTGGVTYSTDGITWTRKSMTPTIGTTYWTVTYNGTNWFVGGTASGSNNAIYASDPSSTWTSISVDVGNTVVWSEYDGTRTLLGDASQSFFYSTSTTFASWTAYLGVQNGTATGGSNHRNNFYYNGRIYQLNGTYVFDFSTTPNSNRFPTSQSAITFSPYTMMGSSVSTLNNNLNCIWAGAAGQMVSGSFQSIFTSF